MSSSRLIVLKFGGSVLQRPEDVHRVAQEIYRWRRQGYRVVAVVSAIGVSTNQLWKQATGFGDGSDSEKQALLVATGELRSAALLGLALDRAGISSFVCDESVSGLRTAGAALDATLTSVDVATLTKKLDQRGVVVVPGFIGRGDLGSLSLLGRGGSDLTALFLASEMHADRCRLIKDVDGLYEYDPKQQPCRPRRFEQVSYDEALKLDESIVQHKAIRFAKRVGLAFEVSGPFVSSSTRVGDFAESRLQQEVQGKWSTAWRTPLRLTLLGLGTVGYGVFRQLTEWFPERFQLESVVVRDPCRALAQGVPVDLITTDAEAAIRGNGDVVLELVGGTDLPGQWIPLALALGKHVVTANKSLLAFQADALQELARKQCVQLLYAAAVGGSLPVLETIQAIQAEDSIVEVRGLLNGASNFILDQARQGHSFQRAVETARQAGLTEQDSQADLGGLDAAQKLVLIARQCGWSLSTQAVMTQALLAVDVNPFDWSQGRTLRQEARITQRTGQVEASVKVRVVSSGHRYADVQGAGNLVELITASGRRILLQGQGAGRWPTTTSVMGDLLELWRGSQSANPTDRTPSRSSADNRDPSAVLVP